jgi:ribosomal protein S18 acetylase RimI-like enzyme
MHTDAQTAVFIRAMIREDRSAIAGLIGSIENFNQAERDCAMELVDIYLNNEDQKDYWFAVAENTPSQPLAYACWGPVPLTQGTFDLYWIATHPDARSCGFGQALMAYVEGNVREQGGRLLVAETSAKESYRKTIEFYQRLNFQEVSRIPDFYDVGDDRLIFTKRLS